MKTAKFAICIQRNGNVKVLVEEFKVPKNTRFGIVQRDTGLERVFIFVDAVNDYRHCAYLHTALKCITGLVDLDKQLGEEIAKEVSRQKGFQVTYGGAAESYQPAREEVLDELIGEAEEQDTED